MGVVYPKQRGNSKKKHRSFLGGIAHDVGHVASGTSRGLYHGVTGLPTGVYTAGRAVGHDLLHPARFGHGRTDQLARNLLKAEIDSYRHFGRGGDVSGPLLDALAALSGGGAVLGKGAALGRATKAGEGLTGARRAILTSHPYSRSIPGTPYRIPASPNPAIRGVQNLVLKNPRVASKALKRRDMQAERFQRALTRGEKSKPYSGPVELPPGVSVAHTEVRKAPNRKVSLGKKAIDAPMNVLRLGMWLRPRYYTQNITQTASMLGSRPLATAGAVRDIRQLRKSDKDLYTDLKNMVGEGQALAMQEGTLSLGKGMATAGRIANAPEAHIRVLSALAQMRRSGIKSNKQMKNIVAQLKSGKPSSKALNIAIRANEDVGDFGRLSKAERTFMKSQVPIFYPMFKALTRYGYRLPSEHSIQSAAGLHLGKAGKEEQKRLLGSLPFWAQYLIPRGAGDPNAIPGPKQAVFNPANIYNLQPMADISQQVVEPFRKGGPRPGVNLLQESGPFGQIAFGGITGHDIQTQYPLRGVGAKAGRQSAAEAAFRDWISSLPLSDVTRVGLGGKPRLKSYEVPSDLRRIMGELFGPSVVSRTLKTQETTKQAKREASFGKGRKKKRKTPKYPSYP